MRSPPGWEEGQNCAHLGKGTPAKCLVPKAPGQLSARNALEGTYLSDPLWPLLAPRLARDPPGIQDAAGKPALVMGGSRVTTKQESTLVRKLAWSNHSWWHLPRDSIPSPSQPQREPGPSRCFHKLPRGRPSVPAESGRVRVGKGFKASGLSGGPKLNKEKQQQEQGEKCLLCSFGPVLLISVLL